MRLIKYLGVVLFALLFHSYLYHSKSIQNLDYKIYDFLTELSVYKLKDSTNVIIVDIDEESLEKYGQWPWPRIINAKLIGQISLLHPSGIGVNIIFSEKDRTSPVNIQSFYKDFFNYTIEMPRLPIGLKDNDVILMESLISAKSTLSIYLSNDKRLLNKCSKLNSELYEFSNIKTSLYANTALCNHADLQEHIKNFGFINAQADSDGLFRRVPLFIEYKQRAIPSFALATLLSIDPIESEIENNRFSILGHPVYMDEDSSVLLNFHSTSPKSISAIDILENKIAKEQIAGKIILLGSSATGVEKGEILSNHKKISNTMIHARLIENILNDELYRQPKNYKKFNLFLSLFLSLFMVYLLYRRWFIAISVLFFLTMTISSIWVSLLYINHVYISIGYLWIPFLFFFFIMSTSFILLYVQEQKKSNDALLQSHVAMVDSMILLATIHDDETGGHLLRTKNYVKLLAEYFYKKKIYLDVLTPTYIATLYEAAPLHDIGKIGIPDAILKKPGKLTVEEFEVMKTHSTLGKNVIQNMLNAYDKNDFLKVAYNIAFYHHEKWNGTGYPMGLKGMEIPIEAQFMTLADVYDALISKRCYKKAFTFEMAEEIIISGKGETYNPKLIEAFLELKEEFKKIALKYHDD
jgi:adenylate cyclase